jgi:hypothetical protein
MDDLPAERSRHFTTIVRYYRKFYEELEHSGAGLYRHTKLGAWAASRAPHVFYFFRTINLAVYNLFIDLGSGDGIVTCIAGLFTRSLGIEIDADLCSMAQNAARTLSLNGRTDFVCGDYLAQRFDKADCLYLYPDKPFNRIAEKLTNWQGAVLVYGPHFPPEALRPVRTLGCGKERMILYSNYR